MFSFWQLCSFPCNFSTPNFLYFLWIRHFWWNVYFYSQVNILPTCISAAQFGFKVHVNSKELTSNTFNGQLRFQFQNVDTRNCRWWNHEHDPSVGGTQRVKATSEEGNGQIDILFRLMALGEKAPPLKKKRPSMLLLHCKISSKYAYSE